MMAHGASPPRALFWAHGGEAPKLPRAIQMMGKQTKRTNNLGSSLPDDPPQSFCLPSFGRTLLARGSYLDISRKCCVWILGMGRGKGGGERKSLEGEIRTGLGSEIQGLRHRQFGTPRQKTKGLHPRARYVDYQG